MTKRKNGILTWFKSIGNVWLDELKASLSDMGVVLMFIFLPLMYPIVYTTLYNPEVIRDMDVVVVDNSRTADSRIFVRKLEASENVHLKGYAASMTEAREAMAEKECYGILEIPENFGRNIGRNEKAFVQFYSDASLLIRYRGFLVALTSASLEMGAEVRQRLLNAAGEVTSSIGGMPNSNKSVLLGNPQQGFASFCMQGVLVFIVQQSLLLGVCMLAAGRRERRIKSGKLADIDAENSPAATVLGRALCYTTFYLPIIFFVLQIVPIIFQLPHSYNFLQVVTFIIPMILATAFLGQVIQVFVKERETSMMIIVFSSVLFLFLAGITWPRYAMSWIWRALGDMIPGVWGVQGYLVMNTNGADLSQVLFPYTMLWVLTIGYFIIACVIQRIILKRNSRQV